jgi:hypothetical protein
MTSHAKLTAIHAFEQARTRGLLTHYRTWTPGTRLVCLDGSHGANFLRTGEVYTVDTLQWEDGWPIVFLAGMARGWEPERFRLRSHP